MAVHGFFVGNNYTGTPSELYGCANDATDSAAEWKPWCATSKIVIGSKADRAGVFKEGKKFLDRLGKGDLGIISISGHGTREKVSNRWIEAVVFADFELGYDYEWAGLLRARAKGSFLAVFADTCHSGGLPRGASRGATKASTNRKRAIPIGQCHTHKHAKLSERDRALPDVNYFSACRAAEYAYDAVFDGRSEGAFTHYLRQAWRERKADGTFAQLFRQLSKYLPDDTYNQTPTYTGSDKNMRRKFSSFVESA